MGWVGKHGRARVQHTIEKYEPPTFLTTFPRFHALRLPGGVFWQVWDGVRLSLPRQRCPLSFAAVH